tara:strand:+ start:241 stop:492 length:252 start_codon:yes stop_codon:yes gene_type:complete
MIDYDLTRAKGLKRHFIRVERAAKFDKLDVDYMRALEANDQAALTDIANKKARLRDAPADPAIDAATNINEVKAVRPSVLDET